MTTAIERHSQERSNPSGKGWGSPVFAPESFWNQPVPPNAAIDGQSDRWMELLALVQAEGGLHINLKEWTMPVFQADAQTPVRQLHPKFLRCPLSHGHVLASEKKLTADHPVGLHASVAEGVPIPDKAAPDSKHDAHMIVIDRDRGKAWDFWQCRREADGLWHTNSAIAYDLDGPGVFTPHDVAGIENDESVHLYGPCRASGVPSLAGLIMEDEIRSGRIAHKLSFACPIPGLQRRVYPPALWTDGWLPGGLPEGCTLQLDPALDLASFGLSPGGLVVARALQEFGAVLVDYAGGTTLYGELLTPHDGRSWDGLLGEWDLKGIPIQHYRILETGPLECTGSHPIYHQGMSRLFYEYLEQHGESAIPSRATPVSSRQTQ